LYTKVATKNELRIKHNDNGKIARRSHHFQKYVKKTVSKFINASLGQNSTREYLLRTATRNYAMSFSRHFYLTTKSSLAIHVTALFYSKSNTNV